MHCWSGLLYYYYYEVLILIQYSFLIFLQQHIITIIIAIDITIDNEHTLLHSSVEEY